MDIIFYVNKSENNRIDKLLESPFTLSGTFREESSVVDPSFIVEADVNITGFNYLYIPSFNRYYFINNITSIRNNVWRIACHVDVLESFKDDILNMDIIMDSSENQGNDYLSGDVWKTKVKTNTTIKSFPNGLLESGEFVLITAGG